MPDELWVVAQPLIPQFSARPRGGGTAPVDDRVVLTAIVCTDQRLRLGGLPEYADTVAAAADDSADLVVVAQSLGGFTGLLVCDRVPVALLVLVAPMILAPGEAPAGYWSGTRYEEEVRERYDDAIAVFYQDVPPELAAEPGTRPVGGPVGGTVAVAGLA